jgi:uncharacterized protein DUF5674
MIRALMSAAARILVSSTPLPRAELARLVGDPFDDMVKFVVDVDRRIVAVGGELHADAEALLLEQGCHQDSLWGGNYHPGRGESECIEFGSMINIRPARGNRGMLVQDSAVRARMREVVFELLGRGEPLP